jgi:hypothetical protein
MEFNSVALGLIKHGGTLPYPIYCDYGYFIKEDEMSVICATFRADSLGEISTGQIVWDA